MSVQPFERKRGITAKNDAPNYTWTLWKGKTYFACCSNAVYGGTSLPFAVAGTRNIWQRWIWFRRRRQTPTVWHCNTSKDEWWKKTGSQSKNAKWETQKAASFMVSLLWKQRNYQQRHCHTNLTGCPLDPRRLLFFLPLPEDGQTCRPPPIWPSVFPVDDGLSLAWSIL